MKNNIKILVREGLLNELRVSLLNYLKSKLPDVPPYVLQDFFYRTLKTSSKEQIAEFIEYHGKFKWELKTNFNITMDIFDKRTSYYLHLRAGGLKNPFEVPNDAERHATQKDLLLKKGLPTEPIILIYEDGKYELVEGWHRTIQAFQLYPEGFTYPNVYVGYE